jgi:hypothetical protein
MRPSSIPIKPNIVKNHDSLPRNPAQGLQLALQQSATARFSNASGMPGHPTLPMRLGATKTSIMTVATVPQVNLRPPSTCTRLSRECQSHGFNPSFRYRRLKTLDGILKYVVDVEINGMKILGDPYNDETTAKNAVAAKGLLYMRGKFPQGVGINRRRSRDMIGNSLSHNVPQISGPSLGPPTAPLGIMDTPNNSWRKENDVPLQRSSSSAPPITTASNVNLPDNVKAAEVDAVLEEEMRKATAMNVHFYLPANVSVAVARAYGEAIGKISQQPQSFGIQSSGVRPYSPQIRGQADATASCFTSLGESGFAHGRPSDRDGFRDAYRGTSDARRLSRSRSPRRERIPDGRNYSHHNRGRRYDRENSRDRARNRARDRF